MAYIVTHTNPHPGPAGVDVPPGGFDLNSALAHACQLLSQGMLDVAIQDGTKTLGRRLRTIAASAAALRLASFEALTEGHRRTGVGLISVLQLKCQSEHDFAAGLNCLAHASRRKAPNRKPTRKAKLNQRSRP